MFSPTSRYANAGTDVVRTSRGASVTVTRLPVRSQPPIRGYHRSIEGQRLDGIAAHYLGDATAFWRLCDAAGVIAPDALGARDLVAVPSKER